MSKVITYQCPGGGGHQFKYLHHPSVEEDPCPRFCPKCGFDSEAEPMAQAVEMPHVSSGMAKARSVSADQTYREMEAGSAHRALVAESMGAEDASGLKITNLKDNLKPGDVAAIEIPRNPVSDVMNTAPNIFGFRGATDGQGYGAMAHTGFAPHAGAKASAMVRTLHAQQSPAIVAAGEKGRY